MRKFILWLAGRDLLKPAEPRRAGMCFAQMPPTLWAVSLVADWAWQFHVPTAPNIVHRLLQRLILGIRWRLK